MLQTGVSIKKLSKPDICLDLKKNRRNCHRNASPFIKKFDQKSDFSLLTFFSLLRKFQKISRIWSLKISTFFNQNKSTSENFFFFCKNVHIYQIILILFMFKLSFGNKSIFFPSHVFSTSSPPISASSQVVGHSVRLPLSTQKCPSGCLKHLAVRPFSAEKHSKMGNLFTVINVITL